MNALADGRLTCRHRWAVRAAGSGRHVTRKVTGRWARLVALVVDEQHRGNGIGRCLVEAAASRANRLCANSDTGRL
ncbi:GNAT family N-acetyltransferase [Micromonospora chalcea]|nr:GNAT family N-acetyltransferase [Micromonospora chalcea]